MINNTEKICYLATPRTASRSTSDLLRFTNSEWHEYTDQDQRMHHLHPRIVPNLNAAKYTLVTTIRHPTEILRSWWMSRSHHRPEQSFEEFLTSGDFCGVSPLLKLLYKDNKTVFPYQQADVFYPYDLGIDGLIYLLCGIKTEMQIDKGYRKKVKRPEITDEALELTEKLVPDDMEFYNEKRSLWSVDLLPDTLYVDKLKQYLNGELDGTTDLANRNKQRHGNAQRPDNYRFTDAAVH